MTGNTKPLHRSTTERVDGIEARRYRVYTDRTLDQISALLRLSPEHRFDMRVVATVLPFRVNDYVIDELIDWSAAPDDPIFRLTFPQREMLAGADFEEMAALLNADADKKTIDAKAWEIRNKLNPHPAGQLQLNIPDHEGDQVEGVQHKYRETVLFFPSQGQTCHAYCTFCFRWAQFVGDKALKMASSEAETLHDYLRANPEVSDLLFTGGDPMIMKTRNFSAYLEPLISPEFESVQTIRVGTKALTFWPYRFVTDPDADDLLRQFERLANAGKHVALMAHLNHWRELDTDVVQTAIRRLRDAGVEIRSQGPLLNNINNDADVWARLWRDQVRLGVFPYYMFVERDTGARHYFEVPLAKAWEIYRDAMQQVSGLGRTARGPSMSAGPGKIEIQGGQRSSGRESVRIAICSGA